MPSYILLYVAYVCAVLIQPAIIQQIIN